MNSSFFLLNILLFLNASKKWFAWSFVRSGSSSSSILSMISISIYKVLGEPPKIFPEAKHLSSYSPLLVGIVDTTNVYLYCSE